MAHAIVLCTKYVFTNEKKFYAFAFVSYVPVNVQCILRRKYFFQSYVIILDITGSNVS